MIDKTRLKDLLSKREYSNLQKILICMVASGDTAAQVKQLKALASSSGLRAVKSWNISQYLSKSNGLAVRTDDGWELTSEGKRRVGELVGPSGASPVPVVASSLRQHLPQISDVQTKTFIEEAIECFETGYLRAAVVLSWVGAVALLQNFIVTNRLPDFNAEALRRDAKWRNAKTTDDLSRLKESEFLQTLESLSVIGKNVKQELESCLKLRNSCGHPNSLKIGESRVASHMEILVLNVYSRFSA
jgi:hypothetical protein